MNVIDVTCLNDQFVRYSAEPRSVAPTKALLLTPHLYRCSCGWVGTTGQMSGDSAGPDLWSNHICAGCGSWHTGLECYEDLGPA